LKINIFRSFIITILFTSIIAIEGCNSNDQKESKSPELEIIPSLKKVLNRGGEIIYANDFWVIADVGDSTTAELASYLASSLRGLTNQDVLITDLYSTRKHNQSISIKINTSIEDPQAYTLDLTSAKVKIEGGSSQGVYYGIKTLLHLLNSTDGRDTIFAIPKVIIKDSPINKVRAVLVTSDQLEGEYFIMSFVMGTLKLNKLIIENNQESEAKISKVTAKNFVQFSNYQEFNSNISIISFGDSLEDLERFYTTYNANLNNEEIILDLRSSSSSAIYNKLIIMAEISWASSNKRSFDDLKKNFDGIE